MYIGKWKAENNLLPQDRVRLVFVLRHGLPVTWTLLNRISVGFLAREPQDPPPCLHLLTEITSVYLHSGLFYVVLGTGPSSLCCTASTLRDHSSPSASQHRLHTCHIPKASSGLGTPRPAAPLLPAAVCIFAGACKHPEGTRKARCGTREVPWTVAGCLQPFQGSRPLLQDRGTHPVPHIRGSGIESRCDNSNFQLKAS